MEKPRLKECDGGVGACLGWFTEGAGFRLPKRGEKVQKCDQCRRFKYDEDAAKWAKSREGKLELKRFEYFASSERLCCDHQCFHDVDECSTGDCKRVGCGV